MIRLTSLNTFVYQSNETLQCSEGMYFETHNSASITIECVVDTSDATSGTWDSDVSGLNCVGMRFRFIDIYDILRLS